LAGKKLGKGPPGERLVIAQKLLRNWIGFNHFAGAAVDD
jgi:hypothetical protein